MNTNTAVVTGLAQRADGLDLNDGAVLMYRGCKIIRYESDFDHGFNVHDLQGNRVTDLPTLRRAKNSVDCIIDG